MDRPGAIVTLPAARLWANAVRARGGCIVLANGAFDLLHVGHLRYLAAARALGDALLVAVNGDASVRRAKGASRPCVPLAERIELLAGLRAVDAVVAFEDDSPAAVIEAVRPHVQAKGTDYTEANVPEGALVRRLGGRVAIVGDAKDHSTTDLLRRLHPPQPFGAMP